jgi:outer membrane lipoprotein-sorting protein
LLVAALAAAAMARAESLAEVLARMDAAAREFRSFSAEVKWTDFTWVLNESSERTGAVRAHRSRAGVFGLLEFRGPDPSVKRFGGRTFETYYPRSNTLEVIDVGKRAGAVEQFLLLGFAVTSAEIRKSWDIKWGGAETIGSVRCSRLELFPKGAETKNLIQKIELWIPEGQGNPIQEKVTKPSRDYTFVAYSGLAVNAPMPAAAFELKTPPDVRKIYPQK